MILKLVDYKYFFFGKFYIYQLKFYGYQNFIYIIFEQLNQFFEYWERIVYIFLEVVLKN